MLVRHLPTDSFTNLALNGPEAIWGLPEQLMAAVVDAVRAGNWQRSGGKGRQPKPIPRPGVSPKAVRRHFGRPARPPHEVAAYLARFRPRD